MRRSYHLFSLVGTLIVIALLALTLTGVMVGKISARAATNSGSPVEVQPAVQHDVSPPLRTMSQSFHPSRVASHQLPLRRLPVPRGTSTQPDPVVQSSATASNAATIMAVKTNGVSTTSTTSANPCDCAPSDANGAVGATQFVQWVNTVFTVYDKKSEKVLMGPTAGNALWSGFGGPCQINNDGDIIAQYDKLADRWVMSQLSVSGGPPFFQCVAVSTTSDATGTYNRYAFQEPNFNDYPKLGIWRDGYYFSFNLFDATTGNLLGARACAMDRSKMLAGAAATQICFQQSPSVSGLLPSDVDGTIAPAAGEPDFYLNFGANVLNLWKFHVDFTTPANSTFTGPTTISVAAFTAACSGGGTCIPQPNTTNQLDSLGDRLMYRLAWRKFSDGHESLVVNHSVTVSGSVTGVRWYEIRNPNGTPTVFQQGTFAPDANSRWMGSIAMDKFGDIVMGYSESSSSLFPSIAITSRVPSEPLGTMEAEILAFKGSGSQINGLTRWGDYSSISVDPKDDCTLWYTNQYLPTTGSFNWSTVIVIFKFTGC